MKTAWMTAGIFGVATSTLAGCGSDSERPAELGSTQQALEACFNTSHSGAEAWIDANCPNGGSYAYTANSPAGEHCMKCKTGSSYSPGSSYNTSSTGYSGSSGNLGSMPSSGGGGGGGAQQTQPTPPKPEPDPNKQKWLCKCCDRVGEWQGDGGGPGAIMGSCGSTNGACVNITNHPEELNAFDSSLSTLGASGAYVKDSEKTTFGDTSPNWWGFLGGGWGVDTTNTRYWSQFDDGDTLRFFGQVASANDTMSSLGDLLSLGVSWAKVPYRVSLASNLINGSLGNDTLDQLRGDYNQVGAKNGVYVRIDENYMRLRVQSNAICSGRLVVSYTIYSQNDDRLLGSVSATYCAIDVEGQPQYVPGRRAGAVSNSSNATSNLRPPSERYYSKKKATLDNICETQNWLIQQQQQQQQANPNCNGRRGAGCQGPQR